MTVTAKPAIASPQPASYVGLAGGHEGGTGYVATYVGPSGSVPVGANPADGEPLTGARTVHVWAEITHEVD